MMIDSSKPSRILIVEDDNACSKMLETMLVKSSFERSKIHRSDCLCSALKVLSQEDIDIVLLDLNLPDSEGLDTLAEVHRLFGHVSIIVITGKYDDHHGRQVIMNGAQDYLIKGMFSAYTLSKSISYAVERNTIMHQLRETEGMYRTIFQNSAVAITFVDEEERLISWNEFTENLLGMDKDDLHMRPIRSLYPQQEWHKIRAQNIRTKGMQHHLETKMIKKDGKEVDVDISLSVLRNDEGDAVFSIGVFRDITRRKETENKLNQALARAKDMTAQAKEANAAKSQFLACMSHDIRTPMNAIVGFSDILANETQNKEQKAHVHIIRESAENLLNLINDILDFSKIEAGQLNTEMIDCSLGKLLNSLESMMRSQAEKKSLDFRIVTNADLPARLHTDPYRLQQCLINLVNNAIKFTGQGHVHLKVTLHEDNDKHFIRFDIEDTGIGIPEDRQQAIFESFTQVEESTTRKYGGTGLGLSITKQLSELLGGELTLNSTPGKGSVFSLAIPRGVDTTRQSLLDQDNALAQGVDESRNADTSLFTGNVLVAEDVEGNQKLMKIMLSRLGVDVVIAEDGNQALQKALSQSFDLIFMDMHMPNMNGYEATRALKQQGYKTPIVALTANAMKGDEQACMEAGCDGYLVKPIDRRELPRILAKYLPVRPEAGSRISAATPTQLHEPEPCGFE